MNKKSIESQSYLPCEMKIIGGRLRQWRMEKGHKLESVVAATGIAIGTISDMENGRYATISKLAVLCRYYGKQIKDVWV